jgi:ATP-binding cassette subfamily C protein
MRAAYAAGRRHFAYAALFSALLNILFIAPMLYMLQVYDRVVPTQGRTTLLFLTLILVLALATLAALEAIRSRLLVRASVQLDLALAAPIMRATLSQSDSGQRLARQAVREFDTLRQAMTGPAVLGLLDAPWVPVYILIAFLIHPWIGVLTLGGACIILALAWRTEVANRDRLHDAQMSAGRSYATYDASVGASDVVRALGLRDALISGHLADRQEMTSLQTDAGLTSARLASYSKFTRLMLQSLALGVGALLAISASISPGAIFASMFIVGRALAPVDQLVGGWRTVIQARGSIETLDELFATTPPEIARTLLPEPDGRLELDGVTVLGAQGQRPILHNIRFAVAPGEVLAIVGPSGAGKSTLVRAIAGAIRPTAGHIRFDGAEQRDWDGDQLAAFVGFMPQETTLFAGSIKDNISRFKVRIGEPATIVDADAIEAAKAAGAHEMILKLPGGYDHQLALGGRGLSAGQAQRVALARALYRTPRFLILDEPNASLDAEGDAQLTKTIEKAKAAGTTILIVAHRMSVLPVIDSLLVIRDGMVALHGGRDEVLRKLGPPQQRVAGVPA